MRKRSETVEVPDSVDSADYEIERFFVIIRRPVGNRKIVPLEEFADTKIQVINKRAIIAVNVAARRRWRRWWAKVTC